MKEEERKLEPPNNKRKRKTHAMGAERVDREEGREEEEEEEEEEDMNCIVKLRRVRQVLNRR